MMKISGRITSCFVALFLVLTSVSAVHRRLDSIDDLKEIDFGGSVPKHSLLLLHWFANEVVIDSRGIRLTFDPNDEDYGSHHYGNYERLLDPLPQRNARCQYYTIGHIYQETSRPLPSYVVNPRTGYDGGNRDRIIIRVCEENAGRGRRIDQVYITQHYHIYEDEGTSYNPEHTYEITTNLLRQIREFSVSDNNQLVPLRNHYARNIDDFQLNCIRNDWGQLAGLGLLLFIVIPPMFSNQSKPTNHRSNLQSSWNEDTDIEGETRYQRRQEQSWVRCGLIVCFAVVLLLVVVLVLFKLTH